MNIEIFKNHLKSEFNWELKTVLEPACIYAGHITYAGLEYDVDNMTQLKMCVYDYNTDTYQTKSLNVDWADNERRRWLASVLLTQFSYIIRDTRTFTQNNIQHDYNNLMRSMGIT